MHDGCLDNKHCGLVFYEDVIFSSAHGTIVPGIKIVDCGYSEEKIGLDAKQALELLAWLRQEEPVLQKKAQELQEYLAFGQRIPIPLKIEETK